MQSPLPVSPHWKPTYTWIIAIGFLILVLLATGIESWSSYRNAIDKTAESAQTTSNLISEWLAASFTLTDHILQDVINDVDPSEIRYPSNNSARHTSLTNLLIRTAKINPMILFLGLFDAQCTVTHASINSVLGLNFKQREYCRLVFQEPIKAFKIAPMFIAYDGKMSVTISYPILTPSQEIVGFALMGLDLSFFQHWLDRIQPVEGLVVSIFDAKEQLLARSPMVQHMIGRWIDAPMLKQFLGSSDAKSFTFRDASLVDGIDRVWAFQRPGKLPFVVVTGLGSVALAEVIALG